MIQNEWKVAVEQAATAAQSIGSLGEDVARVVASRREPVVDWQSVLADFISASVERKLNWTRPNKRYYPDVYMPSRQRDGIGEIVWIVDTSGSISDRQVEQAAAELFAACDTAKPSKVHVVYCHARVSNTESFDLYERPEKLSPVGTGGTNFQPAFDWIEDNEIDPVCAVYLTDLDSFDTPREPDYPVLWISTNYDRDKEGPFGQTISVR